MTIRKEFELKNIKLFVLDLDGTFYLGDRILPNSLRFIIRAKETGRDVLFFTNNTSKVPERYIEKLGNMGLEIKRSDILTSGDVCIDYLKEHYSGASVYLMGTEALCEEFEAKGVRIFRANPEGKAGAKTRAITETKARVNTEATPDVVVCSFDVELTYYKLERACTYIRSGAVFLATHEDVNCPTESGFIPDCGAMCAAITLSTGRKPKYLGKPHKETVEKIINVTGRAPEEIAFVGDRLYTDVACGVNNGAFGFLVLSGETKAGDIRKSPVKPDAVFSDLGEIADML